MLSIWSKAPVQQALTMAGMPVEGHWARREASLRTLTGRERRVFKLGAAATAVGAAAVIAWAVAAGGDAASAPGCVDVYVGSTTGTAHVHACGREGAQLCRQPASANATLAAKFAAACRRAGHPAPAAG
jgi:hypothetical protein